MTRSIYMNIARALNGKEKTVLVTFLTVGIGGYLAFIATVFATLLSKEQLGLFENIWLTCSGILFILLCTVHGFKPERTSSTRPLLREGQLVMVLNFTLIVLAVVWFLP